MRLNFIIVIPFLFILFLLLATVSHVVLPLGTWAVLVLLACILMAGMRRL